MKTNEIVSMLLAAGAVLVVGLLLSRKAAADGTTGEVSRSWGWPASPGMAGAGSGSPDLSWTSEIVNTALPGQPGWGWHYYSNGTAIDPAGNYYFEGVRIR